MERVARPSSDGCLQSGPSIAEEEEEEEEEEEGYGMSGGWWRVSSGLRQSEPPAGPSAMRGTCKELTVAANFLLSNFETNYISWRTHSVQRQPVAPQSVTSCQ